MRNQEKAAKERKEKMIALREAGKTYRDIAEQFGISAQRVCQIISKSCIEDPARKASVDIEKIVYDGLYSLFANDYKMTIAKFARIAFGIKHVSNAQKELIRRFIYNHGAIKLSVQNIKNICEYIGEPFERVFKVRM